MKKLNFAEFKPSIFFLGKFVAFYLVGNIFYGIFVTESLPDPDAATRFVTKQTCSVIRWTGRPASTRDHQRKPVTLLLNGDRTVLSVYEGCNGINTAIIFVSFLFAFGPITRSLLWFVPVGLVAIHAANIGRISALFFISEYAPDFMYFMHKYFFTAVLYVVVFVLWIWWIRRNKHA